MQHVSGNSNDEVALARLIPKENNMDPDLELTKMMLCLPKLTGTEEVLMPRVRAVVKVHWLSKGAIGDQGNMLNMEQDVILVVNELPSLSENSPAFVARKNNPNTPGVAKISTLIKKTC